ncbi:MAG TPA: hypothetical protein VH165_13925 [Kofleriaceae bacterium]|jgi:hypothetical protein|nr:hypothetical protein [Kofleriaceae bacterium]
MAPAHTAVMQDAHWAQLKETLLGRGWTWRDNSLYAPHETMWFSTTNAHPNLALFRDRMTLAAESTAGYTLQSPDQAELHEDLISLVGALDELLEN